MPYSANFSENFADTADKTSFRNISERRSFFSEELSHIITFIKNAFASGCGLPLPQRQRRFLSAENNKRKEREKDKERKKEEQKEGKKESGKDGKSGKKEEQKEGKKESGKDEKGEKKKNRKRQRAKWKKP